MSPLYTHTFNTLKLGVKEALLEKQMLLWIGTEGKNIEDLVTESKLGASDITLLEEISMEVLINLFCANETAVFKKMIIDMGVQILTCHKLNLCLNKWRFSTEEGVKLAEMPKIPVATPNLPAVNARANDSNRKQELHDRFDIECNAESHDEEDDDSDTEADEEEEGDFV